MMAFTHPCRVTYRNMQNNDLRLPIRRERKEMVKITLPDFDTKKAIEIVESIYGSMLWDCRQKNRRIAYPFSVANPVIIENVKTKIEANA